MSGSVRVQRAGPGVSVQDQGRHGWLAHGLSRGGAADLLALAEGAALLGQDAGCAAFEIAGSFLTIEMTRDARIALTGAPMRATIDGRPCAWHASHGLAEGTRLEISGSAGGYSYLHFGGGLQVAQVLGAGSAHLAVGIGRMVAQGDTVPLGTDAGTRTGLTLDVQARFEGGKLRLVPSLQTALFTEGERARFCATRFRKDTRANRMGQRLVFDGEGFATPRGLHILSETIVPGDVQITGNGVPFVLLSECQTTGGYPRIATVLPCDLPRLVQAPPDATLRFEFIALDQAAKLERAEAQRRAGLQGSLRPLIRDPARMPDLLSYQLISGMTAGDDLERSPR